MLEDIISKRDHAVRDNQGGQAVTARERNSSYAGHAVGDGDGDQVATSLKRTYSNTGHAVGDGDGGQAATAGERTSSYVCYGEIYNSLEITLLP